jgi:NADPH:quinone reductase-like Zn-dependent oxidoreductase
LLRRCEEEAMKAIVLTGFGGVEKLELRDVPDPRPGKGEVKIKVAAVGINPIDWKIRSGAFRAPMDFPAILGRDVSGEVVETGTGATRLRRGEKVIGFVEHGYAEHVVAAEDAFAPVPEGLDLHDAAALPLVSLTGAQLVEGGVRPKRGDLVLVTGAVGGVGRSAVYTAKKLGARVIAGVRANQKEEARQLSVEQVAAIDDDAEIARLPQLDAIADTVNGETIAKLIPKIRSGGSLGSVLGEPPAAKGRDLHVRAIRAQPDARQLRAMAEAAARGELVIPVGKRLPLAQAREAQRLAEQGGSGKILLIVS